MARPLITMEYLRDKIGAVDLITLVEFLKKKQVQDHHLKIDGTVKLILHHGMKTTEKAKLQDFEVDEFKRTLLNFKMNDWMTTNLYRINHGVLLVACVEHVLDLNIDNEKLMKIYRCDTRSAERLYKKLLSLCGIKKKGNLNPDIVQSAKSFFRCPEFSTKVGFLDEIRSYLNTIDINDEEKIYIRNTSILLIDNTETINHHPLQRRNDTKTIDTLPPKENNDTETINTIPSRKSNDTETIDTVPLQISDNTVTIKTKRVRKCTINQEYFQNKSKAHVIIDLVKYLKENNIEKENLTEKEKLTAILREGMKKFIKDEPSKKQLEPFQIFLTSRIDMWKAANLYRINYGILAIACVERVLYPGKSNEEYKKIYDGDYQKVTELYKELCDIPEEDQLDPAIVKSAASFFQCTQKCLDSIRPYLEEIKIDYEEMEYIKKTSIKLIKSNEHELSTNMMEPIEYHTINVPVNNEQPNPPMIEIIHPNIPSINVDPPSGTSIPEDQELIISNQDEQSTNMLKPIEYRTINVPINNEQPNPPMIEITYPDIPSLNVDPTSLVSIPVDQELIISNQDEQSTNMLKPIEYHTINVPINNEQPNQPMIEITYPDIPSLNVDPTSLVSIPADQELIISNQDGQSTNMNDPPKYYVINVPYDAEQPHPPMPNMSSLNVDPTSLVSIPVDQELIMSNQDGQLINMNDPIECYTINVPYDAEQPHTPMPNMSSLNVDPTSLASISVDQELIISNQDGQSTNMNEPPKYYVINVPYDAEQPHPPMPNMSSLNVDPTSLVSIPVDQELIMSNQDEQSTNMNDPIEDHSINVPINNEQPNPPMIEIIHPNIPSIIVDPPSGASIPEDQELIISNQDEQSTNMNDPIEDHSINVTFDDEQPRSPPPDVPSLNVVPPAVVSIPVDQELIISNQDEQSTNMNDPIEDHSINVPFDDEQSRSPEPDVPTVKIYLPSTSMVDLTEYNYPILLLCDDEHLSSSTPNASTNNLFSKVSIPLNPGSIKSNEDKSPTNIINLMEEQPSTSSVVSPENSNSCLIDQLVARLPHGISDFIDEQAENLPTIGELTLPSMQDVPSVNVDPPPVVSSPSVNQGFLSRYAPNDVVMARMSDSNFWPAKITQVQDDVMTVEFFSLLDQKTEVTSEEDLKDFTNDVYEEVAASLSSDTLRESLELAIESAYDFKFSY
ncbi:uncharacterized protein LOC106656684 isoform X2 [Trichogramma pretiosum]|uniref:uncharacterized protein LOC106656684 isoform X2 n=1 Tax=Trichogramma pretiosum TaxID=7493 RepID=UPI000C71BF7A|nr:uncharacterized protein LOC106656684 isoform X2 [Trichogramma pretiosum]